MHFSFLICLGKRDTSEQHDSPQDNRCISRDVSTTLCSSCVFVIQYLLWQTVMWVQVCMWMHTTTRAFWRTAQEFLTFDMVLSKLKRRSLIFILRLLWIVHTNLHTSKQEQMFCLSCNVNLALRKPAFQSTNYDQKFHFASNAVDGNRDNIFLLNSCSCTSEETQTPPPWWVVDLLREYSIKRIVITNRGDSNCKYEVLQIYFAVSVYRFANIIHQSTRIKTTQVVEVNCWGTEPDVAICPRQRWEQHTLLNCVSVGNVLFRPHIFCPSKQ